MIIDLCVARACALVGPGLATPLTTTNDGRAANAIGNEGLRGQVRYEL